MTQPPHLPSAPPVVLPARRRRAGLVGWFVLGVALLVCGIPAAVYGVWHANLASGPHHGLPPDVCVAMDGEQIRSLVGDRTPKPWRFEFGDPDEGCRWTSGEEVTDIDALLFPRSLLSSSLDEARAAYREEWNLYRGDEARSVADGRLPSGAVVHLSGAGQEGLCYVSISVSNEVRSLYRSCWVRDGNVVLGITVYSAPPDTEFTHDEAVAAANQFCAIARDLFADLIEDLS